MPNAYTEDQLVEQPTKAWPPSPQASPRDRGFDGQFEELGWQTVSALEEALGQPSLGVLTHIATIDELRDRSP